MGYYSQAIGGQLSLLTRRQPVERLLTELDDAHPSEESAETGTDDRAALRASLERSRRILDFAETRLLLSADGAYRSYVALSSDHVVWNLYAAPALSLEAKHWCYPVVGCAPYRGYFSRNDADRYRQRLVGEGLDTYMAGVAAYSTLGWFKDPLLSSFLSWPEADLAQLLIHELAHLKLWIKGDVRFNESFASFVGRQGMREWLLRNEEGIAEEGTKDPEHDAAKPARDELASRQSAEAATRALRSLLERTRGALEALYAGPETDEVKLQRKSRILSAAVECYRSSGAAPQQVNRLDAGLNNALLVSLATYEDAVPAFARLFEQSGRDWSAFYAAVAGLGALSQVERDAVLEQLGEQQIAAQGDHGRADEIECEALSGHGFDSETAGAEHDHVRRSRDREHERAGSTHRGRNHEELRVNSGTQPCGGEYGHQQRGGCRVAGGFGHEGYGQTDADDHDQNRQSRESG
ncbi:MAG: aminopeptidase [Pseudomonadales bacterium]|nr:aminopeptidase [Pseudomonadales bacterium]